MTNPCQTLDSLLKHLDSCLKHAELENKPSKPLLKNIALMTYALVATRNVQLPKLALRIPLQTTPKNLIQRLERLLKNPRFTEGWHFCIRLRKDRRLENREGKSFQPRDLKLLPWGTRFLKGVCLADLAGESLSLSCAFEGREAWYILSDLRCGSSLLKQYSCRFCTEETFRDWKESGFRLEQTHLVVGERVSRLVFCLCVAPLWSLWRGGRGVRGGERRLLESKKERRLSLLQIGLRLLERAIALGERLPIGTRPALK